MFVRISVVKNTLLAVDRGIKLIANTTRTQSIVAKPKISIDPPQPF